MFRLLIVPSLCLIFCHAFAQPTLESQINTLEAQLKLTHDTESATLERLEALKLQKVQADLVKMGLPTYAVNEPVIQHAAMSLAYSEVHEQARWVAHIITPDIVFGNQSRTNDFRIDTLVPSGSPTIKEYWNSGYDRGHLAPSADFRWSQRAVSESYYYSNMSPQLADLNRGIWAELEGRLREVCIRQKEQIFVVTGGVLEEGLPAIGDSIKVSIPKLYWKVALDYSGDEKKGIGFVIPNAKQFKALGKYAVSIDSIEKLTGINFFTGLSTEEEPSLEGKYNYQLWLNERLREEPEPIDIESLPKGYVNTTAARYHEGNTIGVCGTVVSTKFHEPSGATFLNLDKKFPNQVFSVTIWKDSRPNFSYNPEQHLLNQKVCITGEVRISKGTPTVNLTSEKQIKMLEEVIR